MNKVCVISPKCTSKSAKWLAESLGADYCNPYKSDRTNFADYNAVINFGYSGYAVLPKKVINKPEFVKSSVDKVLTFSTLDGHCRTIPWTTDVDKAVSWIEEKSTVVARTTSVDRNGKGIVFVNSNPMLFERPFALFTRYIDTNIEYRVNVFKGKIITILQKHDNGQGLFDFKLIRGPYTDVMDEFVNAVDKHIGLDMYGMDIIEGTDGELYFIEVNSGPSLFGQTSVQMLSAIEKDIS